MCRLLYLQIGKYSQNLYRNVDLCSLFRLDRGRLNFGSAVCLFFYAAAEFYEKNFISNDELDKGCRRRISEDIRFTDAHAKVVKVDSFSLYYIYCTLQVYECPVRLAQWDRR